MNPCFAIIDRNTLSSMSLRDILSDIYDQVEIYAYRTMNEFIKDSNRHFVHFFVSEDILFGQVDEFDTLKEQTTVMSLGENTNLVKAGFKVLDCTLDTKEMSRRLMELQMTWGGAHNKATKKNITSLLSPREKDVLIHIVKGHINKEIAEYLKISLPTVIFHRNNICDKLQTRSVGKLTVYAVLGGLIELNEI